MQHFEDWLEAVSGIFNTEVDYEENDKDISICFNPNNSSEEVNISLALDEDENVTEYTIVVGDDDCGEEYEGKSLKKFKETLKRISTEV